MLTLTERLLRREPILLDAAVGTALLERGLKLPQEDAISWSQKRPEEISRLHRAHREAGAELILANTFGARAPTPREISAAVSLARESGAPLVAVPLWPGLADRALAEAAKNAEQAGADLLWLETSMRFADSERALSIARRESALPVAATLALAAFPPRASSLAGFIAEARAGFLRLADQGAAIAGLNCGPWDIESGRAPTLPSPGCAVLSPDPGALLQPLPLAELVSAIAHALSIPFALKPDAGFRSPDEWAALIAKAVQAGAKLAGGCCGTDARHLRALRATGHFIA